MINLFKFQEDTRLNAIRLGYRTNRKAILKQLKKEYKEFKRSRWISPYKVHYALNIEDDDTFIEFFDKELKGTIADEIPDMPFILMSYTSSMGHDTEDLYMLKQRYNNLR